MPSFVAWLGVFGACVSVVACGSSDMAASDIDAATPETDAMSSAPDAAHDGGPTAEAGTKDAQLDAPETSTYPAAHAPLPQLTYGGGRLLTTPKLVTVTFEGDTNAATFVAFNQAIGATTWWQKALLPYGIAPATIAATVSLPAPSATSPMTLDAFEAFLADEISSGALPPPDDETLYVVYVPPTLGITDGSSAACNAFDGIHGTFDAPLAEGDAGADGGDAGPTATMNAPFALAFACAGGVAEAEVAASTMIAGAATDPKGNGSGFAMVTDEGWQQQFAVDSPYVADATNLCDQVPVWSEGGHRFGKVYSNAAAALSEDPCQPSTDNYFGAAPDTTTITPTDGGAIEEGIITVHPGSSTTVTVRFFSDAPLASEATLSVGITYESYAAEEPLVPLGDGTTATLSATTAQNGDVLTLTITADATATLRSTPFVLRSTVPSEGFNDWAVELVVE